MALQGAVTINTSAIALGLAKIKVGSSADNISEADPVLVSGDSVGALTSSKFTSEVEWWRHMSGFPELEDLVIVLREKAMLEGEMEEITPLNMAIARGRDPKIAPQTSFAVHSGEVALGDRAVTAAAPAYVRMEAEYTFPNGTNKLQIVFPRAQVTSSLEIDLQSEDNAKVPVVFEAKRADAEVTDGHYVWDERPLGRVIWT